MNLDAKSNVDSPIPYATLVYERQQNMLYVYLFKSCST